jgi:hypothetical protein
MTTQNIGIVLHEELDRREKLVAQLTKECDGLRTALEILERPTPEAHNRVTRVIGRRGPKPKESGGDKRCVVCGKSEADGAAFGKHNAFTDGLDSNCKVCRKAKRDKRAAKNSAPKSNGHASDEPNPRQAEPLPSDAPRLMVKCDRCGDRFPDAKSMGIHKTRAHFYNGTEL